MIDIGLLSFFILVATVIMGIMGFPIIVIPCIAVVLLIISMLHQSYKWKHMIKGAVLIFLMFYIPLVIFLGSLFVSILFYFGKFLRYIFL